MCMLILIIIQEDSTNLMSMPSYTYIPTPAFTYGVAPYSLHYNYWERLSFQYGQYAVANNYFPSLQGNSTGNDINESPLESISSGISNAIVPAIQPQAYTSYDYTYLSYYYGFQSPPVQTSTYDCGAADCNSNPADSGNVAILPSSDLDAVEPASEPT
ncbi:hypothetical protein ANCCAN_19559 [Ancylostoma caninum]|uniref:Uncharacterized protein n=1 Tax=Ancylostoma caninum TaxID=29170 RepID=A0A368FUY0_ANCCA|nr:hypothetical protein ANCCAN_19559 [Ancylostoma caninum]